MLNRIFSLTNLLPQTVTNLYGFWETFVCEDVPSIKIFDRANLFFSGFPFGHTCNSSKESVRAKGMYFFFFPLFFVFQIKFSFT